MLRAALAVAAGYLLLCLALFVLQRSMLYHPPREAGGPVVDFAGHAAAVHAVKGPKALIYFGGNAEDVTRSLEDYAREFPDYAIYMPQYRGFGGNAGTPTEEGLTEDALELFDRVWEKHMQVTVVGRSLGSALAVRVAAEKQVTRVVLITPFDSIEDVARRTFPFLPMGLIVRDKYLSSAHAAGVSAPVLLLAAGEDEMIPRASTELLLTRFTGGNARMAVIAGTGHNDIENSKLFWTYLRRGVTGEGEGY
jgi:uncharacterized protein